jgi:hypothetical protein
MIAITTNNSINVKPCRPDAVESVLRDGRDETKLPEQEPKTIRLKTFPLKAATGYSNLQEKNPV